jgi:antitoxin ParD1/3/4
MAQINISLPDALKHWADMRVSDGDYSSTSDYVRDLVRRDRMYAERMVEFRAAIDSGYASGFRETTPRALIDDVLQRASRKAAGD